MAGMKLVLATPLYPPESGGPATYAKLLVEGLPAYGVEVEVVKFSAVRHLPKFIRHFAYERLVHRALQSADAVLALDPVSVGLPAERAAKNAHKPFFVKIVGDYAWEQGTQRFGIQSDLDTFVKMKQVPLPVALLRKVQTRVALGATRVIVPSNYLKGVICAWGVPEAKIQVIYNSVLLEEGGTLPATLNSSARPRVVTVGRLVPWKNIGGVIDAVAQLKDATLVVVGDGPERARLEAYAKNVLPHTLFTGQLSHADTLAVIADAEVFVLNSSYEGLSHLLIEAMSLGTPTVATRTGGNTELLQHEAGSELVNVDDTFALVEALRRVLAQKKKSSDSFRVRFAPETMLRTTTELLKKTI